MAPAAHHAATTWRHPLLPASLAVLALVVWLVATSSPHASVPLEHCSGGGTSGGGTSTREALAGLASLGAARGPWPTSGDTVHTLFASNGAPGLNYQTLALYGSFRLAQRQPGGDKLVAFTRILHRTADDELSPHVPTVRVQPMRAACDRQCDYVQADRPNAVRKFFEAARTDPSLVQAPWVLFIETDFLFVRPVAAPGPAESGARSVSFEYGNMSPQSPQIKDIMRRLYPVGFGPLTDLPATGPSPTLMRPDEWLRVLPRWESHTAQLEEDRDAKFRLGIMREMYSFVVAAAVERLDLELQSPPNSVLMIQPPVQDDLGKACMMHYTWGSRLRWPNGSDAWHFEKREHHEQWEVDELPLIPLPPPFEEGAWSTPSAAAPQGRPTTRAVYDTILALVEAFNRGLEEVGGPNWKQVLGRSSGSGDGSGAA